ncbi:MAG: addiction module protein [Planctomycetota bacterium]|nr:addiction module protein [Planctomycetota bacterium]
MKIELSELHRLAEDLLSLPPLSRAYLADRLVDSIDQYAEPEIEAAWRSEVERRLEEYEEGKVEGISSEEVFRQARKRLDEARKISS